MPFKYLDDAPQSAPSKFVYLDEQPNQSSMSLKGLGQNALQDITTPWPKKMVDSAIDLAATPEGLGQNALQDITTPWPKKMVDSAIDLAATPGGIGSKVAALGKGLASPILHPIRSAYEQPVSTALAFGTPLLESRGGRVMRPEISPERMATYQAAEAKGIPTTAAERTGSMPLARTEMGLYNTPLGSRPIQKFNQARMEALARVHKMMTQEMGTVADHKQSGMNIQRGIIGESSKANQMRDALFQAVPDMHIPLDESVKMADTIIQEQSKFLPTTRNSDVIGLAKDIQNVHRGISSGEGVTGGPGLQSFSPETKFEPKPNYEQIKRLREVLNARIQSNNPGVASGASLQANQVARDYIRLKVALDSDLDSTVSKPQGPLDRMLAQKFGETYRKAKSFHGTVKELYNSLEIKSILKQNDPEKIVDMVFKRDNPSLVNQFKAAAGDSGWEAAKKRFTQDLLEAKDMKKEMSKYGDTLKAAYNTKELAHLNEWADIREMTKSAEKMAGNPSGTGPATITAGSYGGAGIALKSGHPFSAAAILGGPYLGSKAYLSRPITNLLSRGIETPRARLRLPLRTTPTPQDDQ